MKKQQTTTNVPGPNPKDFLRARRPEQFSDSVKLQEAVIDRSTLEYHFETLNNRSQELQFETFVRKLCEREICPNLVPQTGPTAGGDGKTDTETYPVANQISFFWGLNEAPETERWAFGVSTQKTWKAKCTKDVESIVSTGRGYVRIFCVSSRYIKNSSRVELQDALSKTHGVKVTILDRSWLLDKTLDPKNHHLAIEHLGLTGAIESKFQIGPYDADKQIQLIEIERQIDQIEDPGQLTIPQVDLYTNRAIIYKELERDAYAVRQQFDVAIKVAKKFGTNRQHFDATYELAWAAYWWLEDADLLEETFEKALSLAQETDNVEVWEKILTLFNLLITAHRNGSCTLDITALESVVRAKLDKLAGDADMISSALQAKTALAMLDLLMAESEDTITAAFLTLSSVAESAKKLIGYPMARLINLLEELDVAFGDFDEYETLIDRIIEDAGAREGSRIIADKYLRRGAASLDKKDYYKAIKCLGLSLYGLYNNESKHEVFTALYLLSHAYERQGLLWAARGAALMAAHLVSADAIKEERSSTKQIAIYQRLMWIDGQLGRLSQSLNWYYLSNLVDQMLTGDNWNEDQRMSYECLVGKLFLNAKYSDIQQIAWLPDKLNQLGLPLSAGALLVCLGHEEKVGSEEGPVDLNFMNLWRSVDMGSPVAPLDLYLERWTSISSRILGCDVSVNFPVKSPCIELAQQLLAVLESFCAPMMSDRVVATLPSIKIDISLEDEDEMTLQYSFDTGAQVTSATIRCSGFTIADLDDEQRAKIQYFFTEFCLYFVKVICPQISQEELEKMLRDDKALERAVTFNCNLGLEAFMLGNKKSPGISYHKEPPFEVYAPTRNVTWLEHHKIEPIDCKPKTDDDEKSKHPLQLSALKHRDLKVDSLIQVALWDQAGWKAMGFQTCEGEDPVLMFGFENLAVGTKIFSNIAKTVGAKDPENKLRIVLIRGISRKNPAHYRVVVTSNINYSDNQSSKIQAALSRFHTMTPTSSENLERFLKDYETRKKCHVATVNDEGRLVDHVLTSGVVVRYAWEIDENDQELSAIGLEDDVFVPQGMENPPIIRALAKLRTMRKR